MCGLFGFVGTRPDAGRLAAAAMLAAKRGPDGWGILTDLSSERGLGRLPATLARGIAAERFVVGHCRLATVLGTKLVSACQPLQVGRYAVAHNGTIGNVSEMEQRFGFRLATGNDSEAIPRVMHAMTGTTEQRLMAALDAVDHGGHYAVALVDLENMQVLLRAMSMPLWITRQPEGAYWCSIRPGMEWEPVRG